MRRASKHASENLPGGWQSVHDADNTRDALTAISMEYIRGPVAMGDLAETFEPVNVSRDMVKMGELVGLRLELDDVRVLNNGSIDAEDLDWSWRRHIWRVLYETRAK